MLRNGAVDGALGRQPSEHRGRGCEEDHLHAIDSENVAELEQLDDLVLRPNPDLCPLEGSLGLGMEKDAPDAYF